MSDNNLNDCPLGHCPGDFLTRYSSEKKLIEESHKEMEKMLLVGPILYYIAKAKFT